MTIWSFEVSYEEETQEDGTLLNYGIITLAGVEVFRMEASYPSREYNDEEFVMESFARHLRRALTLTGTPSG